MIYRSKLYIAILIGILIVMFYSNIQYLFEILLYGFYIKLI